MHPGLVGPRAEGGRFSHLMVISLVEPSSRMNDLVSVVVPAFNRATTLGRCIESIVRQNHRHLEVVVVDDGSTDATLETAREWALLDQRVRVVAHGHRRGAQAARNSGLQVASGEWIAFLDSDDYYLPKSIEVRLAAARESGAGVVHSECLVQESEDGDPRPFGVPPLRGRVYRDLLRQQGPLFQTMLIRKDVLWEISGLDEDILAYQEWDTAIRLAKVATFGFVAEPTFVYFLGLTHTISKDMRRCAEGFWQVVTKHWPSILLRAGPRPLAHHCLTASKLFASAGMDKQARRRAWLASAIWPPRLRHLVHLR
jgi:glycosyltransferase involved in cell wall biosynthesis